jgi:hypothetical protein
MMADLWVLIVSALAAGTQRSSAFRVDFGRAVGCGRPVTIRPCPEIQAQTETRVHGLSLVTEATPKCFLANSSQIDSGFGRVIVNDRFGRGAPSRLIE